MYPARREYEQWIARAPQRVVDLEEALRWTLNRLANARNVDGIEQRQAVLAKRDPVPDALRKYLKSS